MDWCGTVDRMTSLFSSLLRRRGSLAPERVAIALYRGILERKPDVAGFAEKVELLRSGQTLERVIRSTHQITGVSLAHFSIISTSDRRFPI